MNIQKLNPIGYEAKTENGNTYKRSNIGKFCSVAAFAAMDASPYIFKKSLTAKFIAGGDWVTWLAEMCKIKIPEKYKGFLTACGIAIDLAIAYCGGKMIDESINRKRIAKADSVEK